MRINAKPVARWVYYPLACALIGSIIALSLDATRLQRVASAQINLSQSADLAWKSVLESLSFSLYSGASDVKDTVQLLSAEAGKRESLARHLSLGFALITVIFLLFDHYQFRRRALTFESVIADRIGVAVICLVAGLVIPILSLKAYTSAPLVGEVIFKYEVKSILTTVITLAKSGNALVAIVLALFSIITPLIKLIIAIAVLQQRLPAWHERGLDMIKAIGKWSMADVFVVAVLVAYFAASSDEFSEAKVGLGLYYFTAYCLISQFATQNLLGTATAVETSS